MRRSMLERCQPGFPEKRHDLLNARTGSAIRIRVLPKISGVATGHPSGESKDGPLDINFDRHLKLDFQAARALRCRIIGVR